MKFLAILFVACLVGLAQGKRDPPRKPASSLPQSDFEMRTWLKTHPFAFKFPTFLHRFFVERLVVNADDFILPPGMLWPFPKYVWNFKTSWWFDTLFNVREIDISM